MNAIATIPDHAPTLLAPDRRRDNAADLAALAVSLSNASVAEIDASAVKSARALVADAAYPRFLDALDKATKPTLRAKLRQHIAVLFTAFPNSGAKTDLAGFGRLLFEDIASIQPSDEALDVAFHHLRTTSKWLPSIAECIEAVTDAMAKQRARLALLTRLPGIVESAERALVRRDEDERRERKRREREAEEIREERRIEAEMWRKAGLDVEGSSTIGAEAETENRSAETRSNAGALMPARAAPAGGRTP